MLLRHSEDRATSFVRGDLGTAAGAAVLSVVVTVIIGASLIQVGLIKSFYSSPFVMLCAIVSNRVCIRAGMGCAALSVLSHEYLFAAPYWQMNWPGSEQALAYASCFLAAWAVARRHPVAPPAAPSSSATSLPFVSRGNGDVARSWWTVASSGHWSEDSMVGAEYGRIYIELARTSMTPPLAWVVRDMIKLRQWSGVECGFLSVVGASALGRQSLTPLVVRPNHAADDDDSRRAVV